MKRIILSIAVMTCFSVASSFAQTGINNFKEYGKTFVENAVISPARLPVLMNNDTKLSEYEMAGIVSEVCQKEGCWLKLNSAKGSNENMMVKMKDHAFLLPKDIAGKRVLIHGVVNKEEVSVKDQKHYLEDAGASKEEISKITEPKQEYVMIADGVKIYE